MKHAPARVCLACVAMFCAIGACGSTGPSVVPTAPTAGGSVAAQFVQFSALVGTASGSCPAIRFTAATRTVETTRGTSFSGGACTDIARGALVEIDGVIGDKDRVLATRVTVASDRPAAAALLADVAAGGFVLFFRHAERDTSALSTAALAEADNRGECRPGSQLTDAGRADAVALGERFKRYGIEVDKVYASPTCRTTEMARLAFGDAFEPTRALAWPGMWNPGEEQSLAPTLRGLLATVPAAGRNIVLVSHNDVIRNSRVGLDLTLDQAEAAIFRPHGGESFELIGRIPKAEWMGR